MKEKTLIIIKPDAVRRRLVGNIIERFERGRFKLCKSRGMTIGIELAKAHYLEHANKDFYQGLVEFLCSGQSMVLVLEKEDAIQDARMLIGTANVSTRLPGTIRGDLSSSLRENLVHAADSVEAAEREIALFFRGG